MTTNEKQSSQKRLELLLYAKKTCIINPKTMNRNLSNYLYFEEEVWRAKNHNILEICMFSIEVHSVSQFIVWSADVMSNIS